MNGFKPEFDPEEHVRKQNIDDISVAISAAMAAAGTTSALTHSFVGDGAASTHDVPRPTYQSILESLHEMRKLFEMPEAGADVQIDRNGNVYPSHLHGMPIQVSPHLPRFKQVAHMRERKWAHRVRFQKERRFDITYENKPCNDVYIANGTAFVHQEQYDLIMKEIPQKPNAFSMGFSCVPSRSPSIMCGTPPMPGDVWKVELPTGPMP